MELNMVVDSETVHVVAVYQEKDRYRLMNTRQSSRTQLLEHVQQPNGHRTLRVGQKGIADDEKRWREIYLMKIIKLARAQKNYAEYYYITFQYLR